MIKPAPPPKRGIAAMLLLFCVVALVAGLGFEFLVETPARFSVIAQPGGRAVLGIGVVAVLVLLAHAMRAVLAVREEGGGDASDRNHS
jgi:hypothetical protein